LADKVFSHSNVFAVKEREEKRKEHLGLGQQRIGQRKNIKL